LKITSVKIVSAVFAGAILLTCIVFGYKAYLAWAEFTYNGKADYVFVGKVIRQVEENKNTGASPETQFVVDVISSANGSLRGNIIVDQHGVGYIHGVYYSTYGGSDVARRSDMGTVKPGEGLLQIGTTYRFAAIYDETNKWYLVGQRGISVIP
jgi:hypothetical protein